MVQSVPTTPPPPAHTPPCLVPKHCLLPFHITASFFHPHLKLDFSIPFITCLVPDVVGYFGLLSSPSLYLGLSSFLLLYGCVLLFVLVLTFSLHFILFVLLMFILLTCVCEISPLCLHFSFSLLTDLTSVCYLLYLVFFIFAYST